MHLSRKTLQTNLSVLKLKVTPSDHLFKKTMVLATHQLWKLFCGKPWKHCRHQVWTKTESDFRRLSSMAYFLKNLFYQNNCKEAINIVGVQSRAALFNFFVVKMLFFVTSRCYPPFLKEFLEMAAKTAKECLQHLNVHYAKYHFVKPSSTKNWWNSHLIAGLPKKRRHE